MWNCILQIIIEITLYVHYSTDLKVLFHDDWATQAIVTSYQILVYPNHKT